MSHCPSEESPLLADRLSRRSASKDRHKSQLESTSAPDETLCLSPNHDTTIVRECKLLLRSSVPLIVTSLLEYSFTVASIFTVGHIGKVELAATATAVLTANITGYSIYQGLATSLDTLCPSAYGAGRKDLVGLHCQRMTFFLWCITVPISILWLFASHILGLFMVPEVAEKAGLYLRILVLGTPGYTAFECGKRFMLAQGLFSATVWVLLLCAPLNALLNYLFAWTFGWGFLGPPIAVAIAQNSMPIVLAIYVRFISGSECWQSLSKDVFRGWWPMVRLALPGMVMVEAEMLAWELLTLASSFISVDHLASQSVISTLGLIAFNFHLPISIASATRLSVLLGAGYFREAKVAAKASVLNAFCFGIILTISLITLRNYLPALFSNDTEVIHLVAAVLPVVGISQAFDSLATSCNGLLRGLGKQNIGGITAVICYYLVGIPIALTLTFKAHWDLTGLTTGAVIALMLTALIEGSFISRINWGKISQQASLRNLS